MSFDYVKKIYGVPAEIGRRVKHGASRLGTIVEDRGHYVGVNFDDHKPGVVCNCHPTSELTYLELGKPRKLTRSQLRWRRYREVSEYFDSFRDWLRWERNNSGGLYGKERLAEAYDRLGQ